MITFVRGTSKPFSSKWYSWKAMREKKKNIIALDQSNNDPAGRAAQLKKSPGETWELLTAAEEPQLGRAWRYTDENMWEILKKSTNYRQGVGWWVMSEGSCGTRWRSLELLRHFLFNLTSCIISFSSAAACVKSHTFTSSKDATASAKMRTWHTS